MTMSLEMLLIAIVAGVVVIVFSNSLSSRIGVAGPLILVAVGVTVGFLPILPAISVAPNIILMGVLPPLLFSAAVSAPAIEFRRDLSAISGLAMLLVVVSAVVLGVFFWWAIPGLGFPLAVALGAILSPTDAVATTIVKKVGAPRRVVTILEGESLLNDASALVLMRTAVVAAASGFSFLTTLGTFAWAVVSALVVGGIAGFIALRLRALTSSATANTALGLTVPYLAYLPTEALGGSGLVAAVAAGVVCGQGSVRWLTPDQRISDKLTWRTIAFVLEGAVFLLMGLELWGIVTRSETGDVGLLTGLGIAAGAFVLLMLVRTAYVLPMMSLHTARVRRLVRRRIEKQDAAATTGPQSSRATRVHADRAYYEASELTARHSAVIVWAGMRGAVTLAAAQTLPTETPQRDLLVFIAFAVSAGSLLIQGLTLPAVARWVGLRRDGAAGPPRKEIKRLNRELGDAAAAAAESGTLRRADRSPFSEAVRLAEPSRLLTPMHASAEIGTEEALEYQLALTAVMRARLHVLGQSGYYSTVALRYVLDELDAVEISLRLHLESER